MVVDQLPRVHLVVEEAVSMIESTVLTPKECLTRMHSFLMIAESDLLIVATTITSLNIVDTVIGHQIIDIGANVMIEVEVTGHTETRANLDDGIDQAMVGIMKMSMAHEEERENL